MEKLLLNIHEVSEYLGLSINTIYCWVSRKKIPYTKINGLLRFEVHQLQRWIRRNSSQKTDLYE